MNIIKNLGMKYPTINSKKKARFLLVECPICKEYFEANAYSIKAGTSTQCRSCASIKVGTIHNCSNTRLYSIFNCMKTRCLNKNTKQYKDYGGRGISISKEWDNFIVFKEWALLNGYQDNLTINRKNNNGNYEPNNCNWENRTIQNRNTRVLACRNKSGYRGVYWHKRDKKWRASISVGKNIYLGNFSSKLEAAIAYDSYIIENNLEHTKNGVVIE